MIRMATICSGIGAPEVASVGLNFSHQFVAEIEPFPSAVLAHHWPHVPNLGDMTKINGEEWRGQVDVLVGGTPCQAFSVAGKRKSLNDERGNLTLKFVELCDAINPSFVVWENVPGVLSTADNAFGCFLGALSGNDGELFPAGQGWSNAGCVIGPRRKLAWRILDAQYFGLAQRRRRVFVVACPRDGADPCEILFEREGVQRHSPPRREKGEGAPGHASTGIGIGVDLQSIALTGEATGTLDAEGQKRGNRGQGVVACFGGNNTSGQIDVATARTASGTASGRMDFESETFAVCITGPITHALKAEGHDGSEDGTGRGYPVIAIQERAICDSLTRSQQAAVTFEPRCARNGRGMPEEIVPPLKAQSGRTGKGDSAPCVAFQTRGSNIDAGKDVTGTIGSNADRASGSAPCVAFDAQNAAAIIDGTCGTLQRDPGGPGGSSCGFAVAFHQNQRAEVTMNDTAGSLKVGGGKPGQGYPAVQHGMQVRRLTARECERLQGFPDYYTRIPWRNKSADDCPDGPRYKALGNSMAIPVVSWVLRRIIQCGVNNGQS